MSRWFRFYADAMRNPKVLRLSDSDFRLWVRLLSIAAESDGILPGDCALRDVLRVRLDHLQGGLNRLISGGLMDALEGGYEPHNWKKFQYKSDTSTDRVQKHRQKRNVSETPPDTDTDTDREDTSVSSPPIVPKKAVGFVLPDWVPEAEWAGFCEMRQRSKAPLTNRARGCIVRELQKLADDGYPPGKVLDQSTQNAWRGVFPLKDGYNGHISAASIQPARQYRRSVGLDLLREFGD